MNESGKRVSWVELYLDLIFVLAVGGLAHIIEAEPEMHSVWIALGLFVTLWWTWIGFAVLYNRHGADTRPDRLIFLAGSVPAGVAAIAIEPASEGHSAAFAIAMALTRIVLAVRELQPTGGSSRAYARGGSAVRRLDLGARAVALRVVGDRDRRRVRRGAARGPRGEAPGAPRPRLHARSRRSIRARRSIRTTSPSGSGCS